MDMIKRFDIIHELAEKKPGLGKTAMMKYLFLLQQIYDMPLGYDFEIYTYGPYASEVMEDINLAKHKNIISMEFDNIGYAISAKDYQDDKTFSNDFENKINELLQLFGDKTAKDLELSTTIIYLYHNSKMNSWGCDKETIANYVYEIKPHFTLETIQAEYDNLEKNKILEKVM